MDFFNSFFHGSVFTAACILFLELTRRPGKKVSSELAVYRAGFGFRVFWLILALGLLVSTIRFFIDPEFQQDAELRVIAPVFLVGSFIALWAIFRYQAIVNEEGLYIRRWPLGKQHVRWRDIQNIYYSSMNMSLVFVDKDCQRVSIDRYIDGTDALRAQIPAELVQRFGGEIDKL